MARHNKAVSMEKGRNTEIKCCKDSGHNEIPGKYK